ncbi:MAG: ROK family protein [Candidatus Njordarchaeales archaeon]
MRKIYVGIDVGATWTRLGLADSGKILQTAKIRTPRRGGELVNVLIESTYKLLSRLDKKGVRLESIGIGSIGPLDLRRGALKNPPNLPVGEVEIAKPLRDEFGVPVYLLNDCSAAVIGEKFFGRGKNISNLVYITISTGIGGGAIVDDHLLLGKDGNAVEVGHIVVDFEGRLRCGCGGYGHWEAYASGNNIPRFAKWLIENKYTDLLEQSMLRNLIKNNLEELDAKTIYSAARKGDELALKIVDEINRINAAGIASVVNIYDPELITLGGGVLLNNKDLILPRVMELLPTYATNRIPRIEITSLGDEIVLYGAIALAMNPDVIPEEFRKWE